MDGKMEFNFPASRSSWTSLTQRALEGNGFPTNENIKQLIDFLSKENWEREHLLWQIEESDYVKEMGFSKQELFHLADEIKTWTSPDLYTASFSKKNSHPVMWSHYASSHHGFCLEFRTHEGKVPHSRCDQILPLFRNSYNGIILEKVYYTDEYECLNGFMANPYLNTPNENWSFSQSILEAIKKKYSHWKYENEIRMTILLSVNMFSDSDYFPEARMYRYDFLHLSGILFGMRMNRFDKHRIRRILERKRHDIFEAFQTLSTKAIIPPIAFYDTYQKAPEYTVENRITMVLDAHNKQRFHTEYEAIREDYEKKKESGNYIVIDNRYDPIEEMSRRLKY